MFNYEEYIKLQKSKVEGLLQKGVNGLNWELENLLTEKEKHINKLVQEIPPKSIKGGVLVIGARFGSDIELLEKAGYKDVVGVDLYDPPLHPKVQCCDAHEISKLKKTYGLIYLYHVMEHLLIPSKVIEEIRKSLRYEGCVSVVVPRLNRKKAIDSQTEFNSFHDLQEAFVRRKFNIVYTEIVDDVMKTAFRKK